MSNPAMPLAEPDLLDTCRRASWSAMWIDERSAPDPGSWPSARSEHWLSHRWVGGSSEAVAARMSDVPGGFDGFCALLDEPASAFADRSGGGWAPWVDPSDVRALSTPPQVTASTDAERTLLALLDPVLARYRSLQAKEISTALTSLAGPDSAAAAGAFADTFPHDVIATMALRTLVLEFAVAWRRGLGCATKRLQGFADQLGGVDGWQRFWAEYPVLLRLLVHVCRRWTHATTELAKRLVADLSLLRRSGLLASNHGPLVRVHLGAGDTHRGGRSVAVLQFRDGSVVYKPRGLAVDLAVARFLESLQPTGAVNLSIPEVLDRGEYGWSRFVQASDRNDADDRGYLDAVGRLLAVGHALQATDLHFENVLRVGSRPVVVDLETVLDLDSKVHLSLPGSTLSSAVWRVGLLPARLGFRVAGESLWRFDLSPLAARIGWDRSPWLMTLVIDGDGPRLRSVSSGENRLDDADSSGPRIGDGQALILAFCDAYRAIEQAAESLISRGVIDGFRGTFVRRIFRATRLYTRLLHDSFHPDFLRDGRDRDILLDRIWNDRTSFEVQRGIVACELRQLRECDVPLFEVDPSSRDLRSADGTVLYAVLDRAPLDDLVEHLRSLSQRDLNLQKRIAGMALACRSPIGSVGRTRVGDAAPVAPGTGTSTALRALADRIRADRLPDSEHAEWVVARRFDDGEWVPERAGRRFDCGLPGIVVVLHAAARVLDDALLRDLAVGAGRTLLAYEGGPVGRHGRLDDEDLVPHDVGWSGATASAAVALATLARHGHALPGAREQAGELLDRLRGAAPQCRSLGVTDGLAGAVLASLTLEPWLGGAALDNAVTIGALLAERCQGVRPTHIGLSSGDAGVALALGRLAMRTDDPRHRSVMVSALLRVSSGVTAHDAVDFVSAGWWDGFAGVGLACHSLTALDGSAAEIAASVANTTRDVLERRRGAPTPHDALRDGSSGELATLVILGGGNDHWARPALSGLAEDPRCGTPGGVESAAFLDGWAGIAAATLAAVDPEEASALLTFDPACTASKP